jgi:hypothetical protein
MRRYYINFNIKLTVTMLSDYVMNSIDNLFSDKLLKSNNHILRSTNTSKSNFNRDIIKSNLSNIIRKSNH